MFTPEEVKAAKATRDAIIRENIAELKSVYMAGEIVMWDETVAKNLQQAHVSGQLVCPFCADTGFDREGLKNHYEKYCEVYRQTNFR